MILSKDEQLKIYKEQINKLGNDLEKSKLDLEITKKDLKTSTINLEITKKDLEKTNLELLRYKQLYLSSRRTIYGKKSEQLPLKKIELFNDAENTVDGEIEKTMKPAINNKEIQTQINSYARRTGKRAAAQAAANTPSHDIYHENTEELQCEHCNATLTKEGDYVEEQLAVIPAVKIMIKHHYPQYRCSNCSLEKGEKSLITTPSTSLLSQTICDPSLLSRIIILKYQYGLPLYRIEKKLQNDLGISLKRSTFSSWIIDCHRKLKGLEQALERSIRQYPYWSMDETGLKVVIGPKEKEDRARNCFMLVRAAIDNKVNKGPVIFNFSERRTNDAISSFIGDYSGVIQTDGLPNYRFAENEGSFTSILCLIHARRKIIEYYTINKNSEQAEELLEKYAKIFEEEGLVETAFRAGDLTVSQFSKERKEKLLPLFADLKESLIKYQKLALPNSKFGNAIKYPLVRWDKLIKCLNYPFAQIHNQRSENAIRPFAIGRRGFLFSFTNSGAKASALYYSIIETCKAMNINSELYLHYLFANAASASSEEDWNNLLPWKVDLKPTEKFLKTLKSAKPDLKRKTPYILRGSHH
jgi:transposase